MGMSYNKYFAMVNIFLCTIYLIVLIVAKEKSSCS
jgi:hypothetical protein